MRGSGRMDDVSSRAKHGLIFGPYRLFAAERRLEKDGAVVPVGSRALDILIALVERAGDVVGNRELMARAWPSTTVDESSVRVHVAGLRKALGDGRDGTRYIVNVPGRGYCFVATATSDPLPTSTPAATGPAPAAPAPPQAAKAPPRSTRLPPRLARMIGRDQTIRDLSEQLVTRRLVTLHGPGGIGKTTTAVATGHALLDEFDGAVCFADLALINDTNLVAGIVAATFDLPVQTSDQPTAVVNYLRDRRALLILDSCEHVIDAAAALAERIAQEAPQVSILATSREPLRVEGEHVHRLSALDSPPEDTALTTEEILSFPAARLFVERATASDSHFQLTDTHVQVIGQICRRLDGIALAIELAAGRVGTHGLNEITALLDNRMRLLWRGRRTASPRHQTMTAALDWSYDLITEPEQAVLRRLSVFVGSFALRAAEEIAADAMVEPSEVLDALEQLVTKSLVSTIAGAEGQTRYRLLEATRAYARAKLDDSGEVAAVSRRNAAYWLRRLEDPSAGVETGGGRSGRLPIEDLGHVRAALDWAFGDGGDVKIGIALVAGAVPIFVEWSLLNESCRWTERALAALTPDIGTAQVEMVLQGALGHALMFTKGHSDRALAALARGLELAELLEDRFSQFKLLSDLHMFRLRSGNYHEMLAIALQAKAVADAIGDPIGLSAAHRQLSSSHHLVGDQDLALTHLETWQPPPSQVCVTSPFSASRIPRVGLSRVLWLRGHPDRALAALRKADEESANLRSPVLACIVTIWGASVLGWLGDWAAVEQRAERLIVHANRYSLEPHRAVGDGLKGAALVRRGEIERGVDLLRGALLKLRADRYELYAPELIHSLAEGLNLAGRRDEALATINDAIGRMEANGGAFDLPEMLRIRGDLLVQAGHEAEAEQDFLRSMDMAQRQSALSWRLRGAMSCARLYLRQARRDDARALMADVHSRFTEGFGTADLKSARDLMNEIGA